MWNLGIVNDRKLSLNSSLTNNNYHLKLLTGLLAIKLNINLTNIEHLAIGLDEFKTAVSKGFIEKPYVVGPINFTPKNIEKLWKLTKNSTDKMKMYYKKINENKTAFSETMTILKPQRITPSLNNNKDGRTGNFTELVASERPGFRKNEKRKMKAFEITKFTFAPVLIIYDEGKNITRNKTGRIKNAYFKTRTAPIKNKQREETTTDSMDIYVPIHKTYPSKFKRRTDKQKTKMSAHRSIIRNRKVNK